MPALPLDEAGKYVAGAYIVFVVLITVYVAIMAAKLQRIERELRELASFAEQQGKPSPDVGETPGGGVREAEQPPVVPPPTGSDRNLTPSEAVGGESRGGGA
jgi:hypothetical protein